MNTSTTYAEKKTLSPSDTLLSNNRSISDSEFITENIHSDRNNLCGSISEEMLKKAVAALLENNKSAFEQTAKKLNLMPDSLVENINEMSYTLIGDISIEHNESGFFTVIDDYRTELEKFAYE